MSAVCATLEVARSNIAEQVAGRRSKRRGRLPQPDEDPVTAINAIIGSLPTHGCGRVHALLTSQAQEQVGLHCTPYQRCGLAQLK
ncbi:hypothetical protein JH26_02230 [Microvirga sp. BSC39]|nr:hypothetical protein JH26_02230 [Microvirga sp. BSC39]